MSKKLFTAPTWAVNTIQLLANKVKGQATSLKSDFDLASLNIKDYVTDDLLVELQDGTLGNSGSNTIGHNSTSVTADNAGDALEENRLIVDNNVSRLTAEENALTTHKSSGDHDNRYYTETEIDNTVVKLTGNQTIAGVKTHTSVVKGVTPVVDADLSTKKYVDDTIITSIPDDSLTNDKLVSDIKIGSLSLLNTTDKSDITSALNEVNEKFLTQESWTLPTLLNGWVNFGGAFAGVAFFKDAVGIVHIKGVIKSGTTTVGTELFILPAGYRPAKYELFTCATGSGNYVLQINSVSGAAELQTAASAGATSISGVSFRAEL